MRFWISPTLERIEILDGEGHSMTVVEDPARYGLDAAAVAAYMQKINDVDADFEFDYLTVITLAEMAGWVRTSHDGDTGGGEIAVSASDVRRARKAVLDLQADGYEFPGGIKLEIESISGNAIVSQYRVLDADAVDLFVHSGRLPMARRYTTPINMESHELVRNVLDARRDASRPFLLA